MSRRALITGAAGGLGQAIATALAGQGVELVLSDLIAAPAFAPPHGARYIHADLANPTDIATLLREAGEIDILVNNAVTRHFGLVENLATQDWDLDIAVNLTACFHTIRGVLPGMKARNWGRIINVSSIFGLIGATERAGYVTAKHALVGLTKAVALECARTGITCNALCPGSTLTPAIAERVEGLVRHSNDTREQVLERFLADRQPTRRFIAPAKVAAFAAFLCTEAASEITGAALPIDGAWSAM